MEQDRALTHRLGIRSLPAYVIEHHGKALLLQSFALNDFIQAIDSLCPQDGF